MQFSSEIFAGLNLSAYLCSAKIKVRYEKMPPPSGYFCIHIHRSNPIGAVTASVSRKAPMALHFKP